MHKSTVPLMLIMCKLQKLVILLPNINTITYLKHEHDAKNIPFQLISYFFEND